MFIRIAELTILHIAFKEPDDNSPRAALIAIHSFQLWTSLADRKFFG
jgi:hypothetical protein